MKTIRCARRLRGGDEIPDRLRPGLAPDGASVREADGDHELLAVARNTHHALPVEDVAGRKLHFLGQIVGGAALRDQDFASLGEQPLERRASGRPVAENHDPAAHSPSCQLQAIRTTTLARASTAYPTA